MHLLPETSGEIAIKLKKKYVNVFLPTTPNPTSGFLLVVPERDLIKLNMNIEQGMKLVISGGIITPDVKNKIKKKSSLRKVNQ